MKRLGIHHAGWVVTLDQDKVFAWSELLANQQYYDSRQASEDEHYQGEFISSYCEHVSFLSAGTVPADKYILTFAYD
jgi:hypothetical protein